MEVFGYEGGGNDYLKVGVIVHNTTRTHNELPQHVLKAAHHLAIVPTTQRTETQTIDLSALVLPSATRRSTTNDDVLPEAAPGLFAPLTTALNNRHCAVYFRQRI